MIAKNIPELNLNLGSLNFNKNNMLNVCGSNLPLHLVASIEAYESEMV
jgi:hypothetical protein